MKRNVSALKLALVLASVIILAIQAGAAFAEDPLKSDGTLMAQNFESGWGSWSFTKSTNAVAEVVTHTGGKRLHLKSPALTDYVWASSNTFTNSNAAYVVEFDYYKPAGVTNTDWHIFGSWNSGTANWSDIRILNTASSITVYHGGGSDTPAYTVPTNKWLHFTIKKETSSSIKLYIDGSLIGTYSQLAGSVNLINVSYLGDPSGSGYTGEGYWDNFSVGTLAADPSNLVYADNLESGSIADWTTATSGGGVVEAAKLNNLYALHIKSLGLTDMASATSPYFAMDNPQYSFEFDYYKPSGVAAKDWHIYGSWNNQSNWNDIRILQSDDVTQGALTVYYGSSQTAAINGALPTDQWVHFLLSRNASGKIELYIDGVYKGTYAPLSTSSGYAMNFGYLGDPSASGYKGEGYWNHFRVATATNAATVYTTGSFAAGGAKTVQIATPGSSLEFSADASYPSPAYFPGFTAASTVRSLSLMDTHDNYHVGGLRWVGRAYGYLHAHLPFNLDVLKVNAKISAFKTTTTTDSFNPLKGRSTYYIFKELPEVVLINTEAERVICATCTNGDSPSYVYSYQAYAKGTNAGTPKYNGARLWFADPNPPGLPWFSGTGISGNDPYTPDGTNGVFLKYWGGNPAPDKSGIYGIYWDPQQLTKGLNLQQYNGSNNWAINPPTGFIFDKTKSWGPYMTANEGYYGIVPTIKFDPLPNVGDKTSSQMLMFFARSSGNLTDMNSIYNLEASFRLPLQQEQLELTTSSRPAVKYKENDGQARGWQIVVMPAEYAGLIPDASLKDNLYAGQPKTVALLKNVTSGSTSTLGELPIYLTSGTSTSYTVDNRSLGTIKSVMVKITVPAGQTVSAVWFGGASVAGFTQTGNELAFLADIPPGNTAIAITF